MKIQNKSFTFCLRPLILFGITVVLVKLSKANPNFVEKVYSNSIYKYIGQFLSSIFSIFPFSLWEFVYLGIFLIPLYAIIKLIYIYFKDSDSFKIYILKYSKILTITLSISYFTFNVLWGINYYRPPLKELLKYSSDEPNVEDLERICNEIIEKINNLREYLKEDINGVAILDSGFSQLAKEAKIGFNFLKINDKPLSGVYGNAKPVMLSKLMSYTGITGMYSPFTGEANVNIDIPSISLPVTICHEMAHQRGIAKEDEANYIAYLACINNPSKEFQYSGYQLALTYLMNNLYNVRKESYEVLRKKYSEGFKRDLNYNYSYWKKKEGTVEKVWNNLNDKYLRSNNQANGVESYGLVTRLLLAEYKTREK